jgi:hypothetical protein
VSNPETTLDEKVLDKTNLILAIHNYQIEKKQKQKEGIDFRVSPPKSDDTILIRAITKPKAKSGFIGIETIREMSEALEKQHYDKTIVIAPRFTKAARNEMKRNNIEPISQQRSSFPRDQLFQAIQTHTDLLCDQKCGYIPKTEADCPGYADGKYSCPIRVTSDNADFHLKRGLRKNLEYDLIRLLEIKEKLQDNEA